MSDPKPFAEVTRIDGLKPFRLYAAGRFIYDSHLVDYPQAHAAAINAAVAAERRDAAAKEMEATAEWPCFIDNPAARSLLRSRAAAIRRGGA